MSRFATLRNARLLMLVGLLLALAGLAGYWLTRDVRRSTLSQDQRELLGLDASTFHASFVVAGRDIFYSKDQADPIYGKGGKIVGWNYQGQTSTAGINTDTILYVDIKGNDLTMVLVPRDLYLRDAGYRINGVYFRNGPDALRGRISALLGVPIDYYAVIKIDIFQDLVNALGGVDINVPYRMYYNDNAGGLHIDFQPGPMHMDGSDAAKFVRYRHTLRGDIDRLDNVKRLAYALLARVKQLNVRAVTKAPELVDTFFKDVETNVSPALVRQLAGRVGSLQLKETATLPTEEIAIDGVGTVLQVDALQINRFMAETFGGTPRTFVEAPGTRLLISNRSGQAGLEDWFRGRLIGLGVPADRIVTRDEGVVDPTPTRLLATLPAWQDADYYASLLHASKQQVDRLGSFERQNVELELVLGSDAVAMVPAPATPARASSAP